jgi:hypothetical protein
MAGGGVEDAYGEDRATEEQLVTPWAFSVARWSITPQFASFGFLLLIFIITTIFPSASGAPETGAVKRKSILGVGLCGKIGRIRRGRFPKLRSDRSRQKPPPVSSFISFQNFRFNFFFLKKAAFGFD